MKIISIIVLCTLAAAVKGALIKEEALAALRSLSDNCVKEVGATDADLDVMMKNLPATNMETKCLRACMMKKVKVISPEGKIDRANVLKFADMHLNGDPEKMKIASEITDACEAIAVPDDHCEAAEMYKMCATDETKKRGVESFI